MAYQINNLDVLVSRSAIREAKSDSFETEPLSILAALFDPGKF